MAIIGLIEYALYFLFAVFLNYSKRVFDLIDLVAELGIFASWCASNPDSVPFENRPFNLLINVTEFL